MRARKSGKHSKKKEKTSSNRRGCERGTGRAIAKVGLLSGVALGMTPSDVMATIIDFSGMPVTLTWGTGDKAKAQLNLDGSTNALGYSADLLITGSHKVMMSTSVGAVSFAGAMGMDAPPLNLLTNGSGYVGAIAAGASIGGSYNAFTSVGMGLPVLTATSSSAMGVAFSSTFYFGFQFSHMSTLVNAWGRFLITGSTVGGNGPFPFSLTLWAGAFEDSGAPILAGAGAIPEPGTFGLTMLGLGALGVQALRRRKKERENSTKRADPASA